MTELLDKPPRIEVHSADDWADAVAAALADRIAQQPDLRLCLPTGSTPVPVYELLPDLLRARAIPTDRLTIVQLDEYLGLPAGHPARCDVTLRGQLLDRLDPPPRFIRLDVDALDPVAACDALTAEVEAIGGLDLVVLGLGTNGHLGMNEPGSAPDSPTRPVDLAPATTAAARRYGAETPPTRGVTLGLGPILAAPEVWLLATGSWKADILRRALTGPIGSDCPASFLRLHPNARLIADEAAAVV
jgi:glucosamine-6-phosphate deaminase